MPGRLVLPDGSLSIHLRHVCHVMFVWLRDLRPYGRHTSDGHFPSSPMRSALDRHKTDERAPDLPDEQLRL